MIVRQQFGRVQDDAKSVYAALGMDTPPDDEVDQDCDEKLQKKP